MKPQGWRFDLRLFSIISIGSRIAALSAILAAATTGCSLDPGAKGQSLRVNLVSNDNATNQFELLSGPSVFSSPSTLNDIGCISLNIRGGGIASSPACSNLIQTGIVSATASSRPATFSVTIPAGVGTVFEALGWQSSTCPDLGTVMSTGIPSDINFNGKVYRIGQTVSDISASTTAVTISTSFDSNQYAQCVAPTAIAARGASQGTSFACAVSASGLVYCWGAGGNYQLGVNSTANSNYPVAVSGSAGSNMSTVSAGSTYACGKSTSGSVYCWGDNSSGQLGINNTAVSSTPVQVLGAGGSGTLSNVSSLSAGGSSACAVTSAGSVYCWGSGSVGQLGQNSTANSSVPVQVLGVGGSGYLSSVSAVTAGSNFACALTSAGTVYCWGGGSSGALGNGASSQSNTPVQVLGVGGSGTLTGVTAIAASSTSNHVCALNNTNDVYCWGANGNGQIGINTTTTATSPNHVVGVGNSGYLTSIRAISVGSTHSCAANTSGVPFCWGSNGSGELGNNTSTQSLVPINVLAPGASTNLASIATISGGTSNTCAIDGTGKIYCWGSGSSGALGNNSSANSLLPSQVSGVGGSGNLNL